MKEIAEKLTNLYENGHKPVLKVEGDIHFKSSIKSGEDGKIQGKRFVKWAAEGLTAGLKIDGS